MQSRHVGSYLLVSLLATCSALAFTPESPEVKALIKRGLAALEAKPGTTLGERVLVGLAVYKAGQEDHRFVKEALAAIQGEQNWTNIDNYSLGLCVIFIAELNDQQFLPLVQKLVDIMLTRQKKHGGFGYEYNTTGDVSQTQYAVLAFWNAKAVGAKVPREAIEQVCEWLLRVQDPAGGWGYQGEDPGNYQRVTQRPVSHPLTAAGLGSVCICADMLDIHRRGNADEDPQETGLPSALKVVKKPKPKGDGAAVDTKVDPQRIDLSIQDGTKWFAQNYRIDIVSWNYYYLYGLERCESYRELYFGKFIKDPKWYNDGVALLTQRANAGGWMGDQSPAVSTSFAVLFLVRSARKAIAKQHKDLGEGVLTSGKGLPTDLANASVKRGKVVDSPLAGAVDDVVAMLDDPENPELSRILESNENFKLDPDLTKRTGQVVKLRSLVTSGNWEARMIAVRGLGKARDLDSVPSLLYALTDPDVRVVQEADAALRFISRKFQGVGLPAEPDKKAIQNARSAWRNWYLGIRPDAELLD